MPNSNSNLGELEPTIAQQVFTIASGLAGGAAGFVLAKRLAGAEKVSAGQVITAATISAISTFGAVYLIQPKQEQ